MSQLTPTLMHRAGEKVFVDFSRKRAVITDRATGEVTFVELFVGVLGASSYLYAEGAQTRDPKTARAPGRS